MIYFNQPEEEYGFLSNQYPASIIMNDIRFYSVKQYIIYYKALLFRDAESAEKILEADTDEELDNLSRRIHDYDDKVWHDTRQILLFRCLIRKFKQNMELLDKLLDTGQELLVGCDPDDAIWGIGIPASDPRCGDIFQWPGRNLLGFTLMQVRQYLRD